MTTNNADLEKYSSVSVDQKDEENYKKDTAFAVQQLDIENQFNESSLKVDEKLAQQASLAIKKRIDATKAYTHQRLADVNRAYELAEGKFPQSDADENIQNSETSNIVNDWMDDLFISFYDLDEALKITDPGDTLQEFIIKSLELKEMDQEPGNRAVFSMAKAAIKKDKRILLSEKFRDMFGNNANGEDHFYIRKLDAVKSLVKDILEKSGYKEKLESYIRQGVVSGLFCFKEDYSEIQKYTVKVSGGNGKEFSQELKKTPSYQFKPKDTRNLIFRKDKIEWVIEKVDQYKFSDILNMTVDKNGEPRNDSPYDYDMLMKVKTELMIVSKEENEETQTKKADNNSIIDMQEAYDIDGDILIYEGFHIPLKIKKDTKVCLITTIYVNGQYITIGVKPSPHFELAFKFWTMFPKDGDIAGYGIPIFLQDLQKTMDNLQNFMIEILKFSMWGIFAYDSEKIENANVLKNITPKTGIALKNMDGLNINGAIQWFNGNLTALASINEVFVLVQNLMKRLSRKGPGGEKISPNPTATEVSILTQELEKSVNRVVLRGGLIFSQMLTNMYKYTILNAVSSLKLKVKAARIRNGANINEKAIEKSLNDIILETDRYVELDVYELFIEDINFSVDGLDKAQKQAVERQQSMQFLNVLSANGYLTPIQNPDGTTSKRFVVDETGTKYEINEYSLLTDLARKMNVNDFLIRSRESIPKPSPALSPSNAGGGIPAPSLNSMPREQDILKGAVQI